MLPASPLGGSQPKKKKGAGRVLINIFEPITSILSFRIRILRTLAGLFLPGLEFPDMWFIKTEVEHLLFCLDDLMDRLWEGWPSLWDSPLPSPYQDVEIISKMEFMRQGLPLATLSLLRSSSLSLKGLSSGYRGSEAHRTNRCCFVAIAYPREQEKNCGFGQS